MSQYFTYQDQEIGSGDTVRVHQEITEGSKSRVQVFEGIVIAIKGAGAGKTFTVRRIGANNVGVEKIYPVQLPSIKKIEVKRKGKVRRGKLYFLRGRIGRQATRVKEQNLFETQTAAKLAAAKSAAKA